MHPYCCVMFLSVLIHCCSTNVLDSLYRSDIGVYKQLRPKTYQSTFYGPKSYYAAASHQKPRYDYSDSTATVDISHRPDGFQYWIVNQNKGGISTVRRSQQFLSKKRRYR